MDRPVGCHPVHLAEGVFPNLALVFPSTLTCLSLVEVILIMRLLCISDLILSGEAQLAAVADILL